MTQKTTSVEPTDVVFYMDTAGLIWATQTISKNLKKF